jgi:hypothetical protein
VFLKLVAKKFEQNKMGDTEEDKTREVRVFETLLSTDTNSAQIGRWTTAGAEKSCMDVRWMRYQYTH